MRSLLLLLVLSSSAAAQTVVQYGTPYTAQSYGSSTVTRYTYQGGYRMALPATGQAIINRDPVAYAHAQREANMIAAMGANYANGPGRGHPLGCAPGCRYSGTGYTWDANRPGHCYEDELPTSRIVARARARGVNGAWFWSAHYR